MKKYIYEYEFKIKTLKNNFSLSMKALCVPKITDTMNGRYLDIAIQQNSFLKEQDLADDGIGSGEIDVLIGADLYWVFLMEMSRKMIAQAYLSSRRNLGGWLVVLCLELI